MKKFHYYVAILFVLGASTAFASDYKHVPGAACVPSKPSQASQFSYRGGSIRNNNSQNRLSVDCALVKDKSASGVGSLSGTWVTYTHAGLGSGKKGVLQCILFIRNTVTAPGTLSDSATQQTSTAGDGILSMGSVDYVNTWWDKAYLRCKVPPRSSVHGVLYREENPTDTN